MSLIKSAHEYLIQYGIKPSVQRIAIMDFLIRHRIHPTVEDIYNALVLSIPTLSKTTVYNTLKLFVEQGALLSLVIDEKNVRFDIDISNHAHFHCLGCGQVYDVVVENINGIDTKTIDGFTVTEMHLYYKGYCKECRIPEKVENKNVVCPQNNMNQ